MSSLEGRPIWEKTTPPPVSYAPLRGHHQANVCIIGGGLSGLSSALHLCRKGVDVVLLEAQTIAAGASGRNNGQIIPILKYDNPDDLRKSSVYADYWIELVGGSAQYLFDIINELKISCDAKQNGWVQPAHNDATLRIAEHRFNSWCKENSDTEWLEQSETTQLLGTTYYKAAVRWKSGGTINPKALCQGLTAKAQTFGARIHEFSQAVSFSKQGQKWLVTTNSGASVACESIVIATAAYSGSLLPKLAASILPLSFYQISTQPLNNEQIYTSLPSSAAYSDLHRDMHWFRYDRDHRLITGSALASQFNWYSKIKKIAEKRVNKIYPNLKNVRFDEAWRGQVAMTHDYLPKIFEYKPGIIGWYGCNGRGVALSVSMGKVLAEMLCSAHTMPLSPAPLTPVPGARVVMPFAAGLALNTYRLLDYLQL